MTARDKTDQKGAESAAPGSGKGAADWELEANRLASEYPVLECLSVLANSFGRQTSVSALCSGLPLPRDGTVTPGIFIRAAESVKLRARLARKPLDILANAPNLPCILVLKGGQACILKGQDTGGKEPKMLVSFPETPNEVTGVTADKLEKIYAGYAFYVRPEARLDERAGPAATEYNRDWFWGAIWANKKIYIEVMIAALMINLFALASPLFIMNVYDRVVPNRTFETLWVLAAGVAIVYIFDLILKTLRSHFLDAAGRRADRVISARIFEHMMGMKMNARPPSSAALASNMREFEGLRDFFTSATITAVIDFPFALLFILLIWIIGGEIAVVPAVIVPIVLAVGLYLQRPLGKVVNETMKESAYKQSLLIDAISGLEAVKINAAEGHVQRKWEELVSLTSRTSSKARNISAFGVNFTAFMAAMTTVSVVIYGTYMIAEGNLTMGAMIAVVILSSRCIAPLAQVAAVLTRLAQSRHALHRLDELMQGEVERPAGASLISMPLAEGRIEFRDVSFSYPHQTRPALDHIGFSVQPGEKVGIIGTAGSGKTTLLRLVLNLYQPASGSVLLDGTDVRQIEPADLRRNLGVVQQSPYLFYGSIRDNITMGHESVDEKALLAAAELSGVMEFLRDTEAGLDYQVGEHGERLSGGQRQSVAIARALLYDPQVMLLDEPTASLDPSSEKRLFQRLDSVIRDKTIILITHKGAMLGLVDKLILMDRGKIVAMGPRDQILKGLQEGRFRHVDPAKPQPNQRPQSQPSPVQDEEDEV